VRNLLFITKVAMMMHHLKSTLRLIKFNHIKTDYVATTAKQVKTTKLKEERQLNH
jgi:hypothetical protein